MSRFPLKAANNNSWKPSGAHLAQRLAEGLLGEGEPAGLASSYFGSCSTGRAKPTLIWRNSQVRSGHPQPEGRWAIWRNTQVRSGHHPRLAIHHGDNKKKGSQGAQTTEVPTTCATCLCLPPPKKKHILLKPPEKTPSPGPRPFLEELLPNAGGGRGPCGLKAMGSNGCGASSTCTRHMATSTMGGFHRCPILEEFRWVSLVDDVKPPLLNQGSPSIFLFPKNTRKGHLWGGSFMDLPK